MITLRFSIIVTVLLTFKVPESHYNGSGISFPVIVQSIVFRGF